MVCDGMAIPYIICDGARCDKNFLEKEKVENTSQPANLLVKMALEFLIANTLSPKCLMVSSQNFWQKA